MREIDYYEKPRRRWDGIITKDVEEKVQGPEPGSVSVRQGPVIESCEYGNAREGSINGRTLPDLTSNCYLAVLSVDTGTTVSV